MAKKKRYVEDGKIYFVRVTLTLHNGKIITGMEDTTIASVDSNYRTYFSKAMDKWGDHIHTCEIEMISKHDPRAKKYMKENGISIPSSEPDIIEDKPEPTGTWIWPERKTGPTKYRSNPLKDDRPTIGEMAELKRKNNERSIK